MHFDLCGNLPDSGDMPATIEKSKSRAANTERLEARISAELKRTIAHAAHLEGCSITDFVLDSVRKSAQATILEHEVIRLNTDESRAFVRALLHPRKPNAKLRAAFTDYRQRVSAE